MKRLLRNGTGYTGLAAQNAKARRAAEEAYSALAECRPNARDYSSDDGAELTSDSLKHQAAAEKLSAVMRFLDEKRTELRKARMDPTENLNRQRELTDRILSFASDKSISNTVLDMAIELSELASSLDEWLVDGGFKPDQWCVGVKQ